MAHNIIDFGAIENDSSVEAEQTNVEAILNAFKAANSTDNDDNIVLIPEGKTFSALQLGGWIANVKNVEVVIDGTLLMSKNYKNFTTLADLLHKPIDDDIAPFIFFY